jgi:hypothetical protein
VRQVLEVVEPVWFGDKEGADDARVALGGAQADEESHQ